MKVNTKQETEWKELVEWAKRVLALFKSKFKEKYDGENHKNIVINARIILILDKWMKHYLKLVKKKKDDYF